MKLWFLIHCKIGQELVAVANLENQEFETYCPLIKVNNKKGSAHVKTDQTPLFPGYIFLFVDPTQQSLSPVTSTRGVLRLVKFGNQFAIASAEIIYQIRKKVAEGIKRRCESRALKAGDKIIVNHKGFDDMNAVFSNTCGRERVIIFLNILGFNSRVSVPINCITLID